MSTKLLTVSNVRKSFKTGGILSSTEIVAVNNISFSFTRDKPEIFSIIGESGSGKTTLSRLILRLLLPDEGNIVLNDINVNTIKGRANELKYMSMVQPIFQNPFETFNPLNKVDHFLFATAKNFFPDPAETRIRTEEALNAVGLSLAEVEDRYPHELSGGQLQRISIARAIIPKPGLLLADEPVSMVDASLRMSIVNLFRDLKEKLGTSIIYITHDLATAYYISDKIAIMHRGSFVEMGKTQSILMNPRHPYTKLLVDSVLKPDPKDNKWEEYKPAQFEKDEYGSTGCKFAARCLQASAKCRLSMPPEFGKPEEFVRCFLHENA